MILPLLLACQTSSSPTEMEMPTEQVAVVVPTEEAATSTRGPMGTGIGIRGSWKIEVRDPDGTLVSTHEFHNDYTDGADALADILTGTKSAGAWSIVLHGACADNFASETFCVISEPGVTYWAANNLGDAAATTLAVSRPSAKTIELRGAINANRSGGGSISIVATRLGVCDPSIAPDSCNEIEFQSFTSTSVTAIPLAEGQQIMATVTLDFATAP